MMRNWLSAFSFVFASSFAHAGALVSFGTNLSFDHAPDGRNYQVDTALAFRGGYRFSLADTYLEFSRYSRNESVGVFGIDRAHTEWTLWGRHVVNLPFFVQPYAAAGMGIQYETVTTRFQTETADDSGTPELTGQLAVGIRKIVLERLNLEIEGRMGVSRTYAPNPLLGVGAYVGWSF